MAAPWIDWRLAAEIEPFPREVLQQRFGYKTPEHHNQGEQLLWGDMTEVTPELARSRGVPLPDILVAGTPCQAFSIAGLRKGTNDERGNLTLKFVETCHAIADARPDGKLAVLWENVPGVLSDKGNAFGCFLGGLVGAMDALPSPDGGSWPSEGMVQGPRSRAAWCVLDAQFFGVAQRRRRVFVVVDFGGACDPAQVLLEPESLRGNPPARQKAGEGTAGTLTTRTCLSVGVQDACEGHLIPKWPAEIAPTLNAAFGDKQGLEDQHALSGAGLFVPSPHPAIGWSEELTASEELAGTIQRGGSGGRHDGVYANSEVRKLTPTEFARLQGFPDDHTNITYKGKPAADGNQYKAYGNSMAVPCIAWIVNRMTAGVQA